MRLIVMTALAVTALGGGQALAASCSSWKAICESRGGGSACDAKYAKCLKTGRFTEGAKWGGATHSGLSKN